jgi:hypothetical protein
MAICVKLSKKLSPSFKRRGRSMSKKDLVELLRSFSVITLLGIRMEIKPVQSQPHPAKLEAIIRNQLKVGIVQVANGTALKTVKFMIPQI